MKIEKPRVQKEKEHFKNLQKKPSKITDKATEEIIYSKKDKTLTFQEGGN